MRARFHAGEPVRVLHLDKTGHVRTPYYVRGKIGTVKELCGHFLNPEDLAFGITSGPVVPLYRVTFRQIDLWADYRGSPRDALCIEIYDHWLIAA
jgi:nitrile hydratase subunit beta